MKPEAAHLPALMLTHALHYSISPRCSRPPQLLTLSHATGGQQTKLIRFWTAITLYFTQINTVYTLSFSRANEYHCRLHQPHKYHQTCPCLGHTAPCQNSPENVPQARCMIADTVSANSYLVAATVSWPSGRNSVTWRWWHCWPWIVCCIYFGRAEENPRTHLEEEAPIRKPEPSLLPESQAWTACPGNPAPPEPHSTAKATEITLITF